MIDEARIQNRRKDCLICFKKKVSADEGFEASETSEMATGDDKAGTESEEHLHISGRVLSWYADKLLIPWVKPIVLVAFALLFGLCVYSAMQLELHFDYRSVLPSDSYVIRFANTANSYLNRTGPSPFIYFRFVNQSDPVIQAQMQAYVDEIVAIDAISRPPFHFWLQDYNDCISDRDNEETIRGMHFNETLHWFLDNCSVYDYRDDLLLEDGSILASRTRVHMDNVNVTELYDALDAVIDQRQVSQQHSVNQGRGDWAFFTYDPIYLLLEFVLLTPDQLSQSTVTAICSVSGMSLFFMPHWSGVFFVGTMILILYLDLLGVVQLAGLDVNGVTYVSLVMAIGLLVDYVCHGPSLHCGLSVGLLAF